MYNMFLKARNKKGFTIIELVIVIAIIGILSAVLIPNFSGVVFNAQEGAAVANLSSINKIAKSAIGVNNTTLVDGYAAAAENFGYESVKAAVTSTVYSSKKVEFVPLKDVKVENEKYDLTNYYPVADANGKTAVENFEALPFVEKVEGANNFINAMTTLTLDGTRDNSDYLGTYFVKGSIALYDNLKLDGYVVVFLDGASIELNGNELATKALILLDTSGSKEKVTFNVNGGRVVAHMGYAATSVDNFWTESGEMNLSAEPNMVTTDNNLDIYQRGVVFYLNYGGIYVNAASATDRFIQSGVYVSENGTATLEGESRVVFENASFMYPNNGNEGASDNAAVRLKTNTDKTKVTVEDGSIVAFVFDSNEAAKAVNPSFSAGQTWASVTPINSARLSASQQQIFQTWAKAGVSEAEIMATANQFATAMYNTAKSISASTSNYVGVKVTGDNLAAISASGASLTQAVYGAITSGSNTATAAVANVSVGAAIASLAGVSNQGQLANVAKSSVNAVAGGNTSTKYTSTDYSFYVSEDDDPNGYTDYDPETGYKVYHITNAKQLYTLSWIVAKGLDDFYGTVVSIDANIDLKNFDPWQPIGNGQYGFRGNMVGKEGSYTYVKTNGQSVTRKYPTISGVRIGSSSTSNLISMMGNAWSCTTGKTSLEGVNYGSQTGDKYALGFIGVLENGGSVENLFFSDCVVDFQYNWNCSAGIVAGAVVSTGEDYSWRISEDNASYIVGTYTAGGRTYAKYDTTGDPVGYAEKGPMWGDEDGNEWVSKNINDVKTGKMVTDINYRAYKGWVTEIKNVETDDDCLVKCSGRPGGIIGSSGGRFSEGNPNNPYGNAGTVWKAATKDSGYDKNLSIFCSFGTVNVDGCVNRATVTQVFNYPAYVDSAGIVAYFVSKGGSGYKWNVTNCENYGTISGARAGGIVCDTRAGVNIKNASGYVAATQNGVEDSFGNVNYGTIVSAATDPSSIANKSHAHGTIYADQKNLD